MKSLLTLFLSTACLVSLTAPALGEIKANLSLIVWDNASDVPLDGAAVTIFNGEGAQLVSASVSDIEGQIHLTELPVGYYRQGRV